MNLNSPLQRAEVTFDRYDMESYRLFLRAKTLPEKTIGYDWQSDAYTLTTAARFAARLGILPPVRETDIRPLAPHLFDYQSHFLGEALEAKKFAFFWDCGLGKSAAELEFGRQVVATTGGKFLHLPPLSVIPEMHKESAKWYGDSLPLLTLKTREALIQWLQDPDAPKTAITNHEKFNTDLPELKNLAGISLDESGMLKTQGGARKWALMRSTRGIEFKLSASATPAPNDAMEYLSQAGFLDKFDDGSGAGPALASCFKRDEEQQWRLQAHARPRFYELLASWSVYLRHPANYGFKDNRKRVPEPLYIPHELPATDEQITQARELCSKAGQSGLFTEYERLGATIRQRLSQVARGFLYSEEAKEGRWIPFPSHKPSRVAIIVADEVSARGNPTLVWVQFDAEADILKPFLSAIGTVGVIDGRTNPAERERIITATETGEIQILIAKPSTLGFGRNMTQFKAVVFSGFSDSFEQWYQAIRRCVRYGQKAAVRVHLPYVPELEGQVYHNLKDKAARFEDDAARMEAAYRAAYRTHLCKGGAK